MSLVRLNPSASMWCGRDTHPRLDTRSMLPSRHLHRLSNLPAHRSRRHTDARRDCEPHSLHVVVHSLVGTVGDSFSNPQAGAGSGDAEDTSRAIGSVRRPHATAMKTFRPASSPCRVTIGRSSSCRGKPLSGRSCQSHPLETASAGALPPTQGRTPRARWR